MPTKLTIEQRRNFVADRRYKYALFSMRPCRTCVAFGVPCQVNREYLKCEECYRKNRKCDLAPDYQGMDEAIQNAKKLDDEITKLRLRIARKTKQRKHWLRRLKDMGDAESKNILEIEEGEGEVECSEEVPEALFDTTFDPSLFAPLSPNALSTLMSDFVAGENVAACQGTSSSS